MTKNGRFFWVLSYGVTQYGVTCIGIKIGFSVMIYAYVTVRKQI